MCGVVGVPCLPPLASPVAPLQHCVASWPQLEQARVNKANARREKKARKRSEIKSNYVLMNGKMSKWFTVHNRHLVPGNPSCSQSCSCACACASAWPGATFLSRRACVRFLAELKMWSKTKAAKTEPPPPLPHEHKKTAKAKEKFKFHFRLARVLGRIISGPSSSVLPLSLCPLCLFLVFAWLSVCLLGFIVVCLFVYLIIPSHPSPPLVLPLGLDPPLRPRCQWKQFLVVLFIYLFRFFFRFFLLIFPAEFDANLIYCLLPREGELWPPLP